MNVIVFFFSFVVFYCIVDIICKYYEGNVDIVNEKKK